MPRQLTLAGRAASLDRRRALIYLTLIILILSPFIASLVSLDNEKRRTVEARDLPELYVLAVEGLNLTAGSIRIGEEPPGAAYNYSVEAYEGLEGFQAPSVPGFLGNISKTVEAYRTVAQSGIVLYNSSQTILDAIDGARSVTESLRQCRIQEALEEWGRVKPAIDAAKKALQEALDAVTSVNPDYLLANEHRAVVRDTAILLLALQDNLERLEEVMKIVESNAGDLEKLCNGEQTRKGMEAALDVASIARGAQGPSPLRIDMLGLSTAFAALGQQGTGGEAGPNAPIISGGGQGGMGAGYGVPPSDD